MNINQIKKSIINDKRIKKIINKVSSGKYRQLSFSEKLMIYKEFNNIINDILDNNLRIYANKTSKNSIKRDVKISPSDKLIIVDGLSKNPYIYLKDILLQHLLYINTEEGYLTQIGAVGYNENYLSSESNLVFYNEENLWIVKKVVDIMDELLKDIKNDNKKDYEKDFDRIVTREAERELIEANEILDKELKFGSYEAIISLHNILNKELVSKTTSSEKYLALLTLDDVINGLSYLADINTGANFNINKNLKRFMEIFFNEYKDKITVSVKGNAVYINDRVIPENKMFMDYLFKSIYKVEKKENKLSNLISEEELSLYNKSNKCNYNKIDYYFISKLNKIDECLDDKNLGWINYVKWSKIYKGNKQKSIYKDKSDVFRDLLDNDEFIVLVEKYLTTKNRNEKDYLNRMFAMMNKSYFNSNFKLNFDDSKSSNGGLGEASESEATISINGSIDKIDTLATIFHEFRHLIQENEIKHNNGIFNNFIYPKIAYNYKNSAFKEGYSYATNDTYGYSNFQFYIMQPIEYDAETFSRWFLKEILSRLDIHINYDQYFMVSNDTTFFNQEKYSLLLYDNYLKLNDIKSLYDSDEKDYKEIMYSIDKVKDKEVAINIFKHPRFTNLEIDDQLKVFQLIAGDINIEYNKLCKFVCIDNKIISLENSTAYDIIEKILLIQSLKLVREGQLKSNEINDYIYNQSRKYKPYKYDINNITSAYYYHACFDKYYTRRLNKNKNFVKRKSK